MNEGVDSMHALLWIHHQPGSIDNGPSCATIPYQKVDFTILVEGVDVRCLPDIPATGRDSAVFAIASTRSDNSGPDRVCACVTAPERVRTAATKVPFTTASTRKISEIRDQRSEIRGQRSEIISQRSENRNAPERNKPVL